MKRLLACLLVLVMAAALMAGCQPKAPAAEAPAAAPAAEPAAEAPAEEAPAADPNAVAVTEWTIPVLSAVTGPVSFVGEPAAWAAQYAADQINAQGGIRGVPVKVEIGDTEFSAEVGAQIASGLVDESIAIVGCIAAPVSLAIGQIVYDAKVPNIGSYSYQQIRDDYAPYACGYMSDSEKGDLDFCAAWCTSKGYKNIVVFYTPSDASQTASKELLEAKLTETCGTNIVGFVEVETGTLDCGSAAVQALNYGADAYYLGLRKDEAGKLINELRTRGVESGEQIAATFSAFDPGLIEICGENGEGVYIWNKLDPNYSGEEWQALAAAYTEKFGSGPSAPPVPGFYNSMIALKQCFEELEITGDPAKLAEEREAIANWLFNSPEINGIQGPFSWVNGQMMTGTSAFVIQGGQFTSTAF